MQDYRFMKPIEVSNFFLLSAQGIIDVVKTTVMPVSALHAGTVKERESQKQKVVRSFT